jgi:phage N-6-adenine-methyltransferase
MNRDDAQEYTDALGQVVGGGWRQVALGVRLGVPEALELSTRDWVKLIGGYVRPELEERRQAVLELTAPEDDGGMGFTQRQAGEVLGVGRSTVNRDLSQMGQPAALDEDEPAAGVPNGTRPHVAQATGEDEWYTPAPYIVAARSVMGAIDLDPASSKTANETVGADRYYTVEEDGLTQPWAGRVWMNPPYAQPLVDRFATRLAREHAAGAVVEAITLLNNATETAWFQELAAQAAALCFPRGRVHFWHPGKSSAPLQGQVVVYLGGRPGTFAAGFHRFGSVWTQP